MQGYGRHQELLREPTEEYRSLSPFHLDRDIDPRLLNNAMPAEQQRRGLGRQDQMRDMWQSGRITDPSDHFGNPSGSDSALRDSTNE